MAGTPVARGPGGRRCDRVGHPGRYDPAYDPAGKMRDTAMALLELLASVATAAQKE